MNERNLNGNNDICKPLYFECVHIGRRAKEIEPLLRRGALVAVRGGFINDDVTNGKIVRVDDIQVLSAS